jgi:chromosome segregation ATPase
MSEDSDSTSLEAPDDLSLSITTTDPTCDQLRAANSELKSENENLRQQLEHAIEFGSQVKAAQARYQKVASELREVKGEKEDLLRRLEISRQTNQQLTKDLQNEQRHRSAQSESSASAMSAEIEKVRAQGAQQIESLSSEIEKQKQEYEQCAIQHKVLVGRVERLVQSAQRFFKRSIPSIEDVTDILEQGCLLLQGEGNQPQAESEHLERQIRKLKTKVSRRNSEKREIETAYIHLERELQETTAIAKQQIADAERKIAQLQEKRAMEDVAQSNTVTQLQKRVEELKAENNRLRELQQQPIAAAPSPVDAGRATQLRDAEAAKDRLAEKLRSVTEQLQTSQTKRDQLATDLRDSEVANAQLQSQVEKLKTENTSLHALCDESYAQIESLRTALHARQPEPAKPVQQGPDPSVLKRAQRELSNAKKEIAKLNAAGNQQRQQIENQLAELRDLKAQNEAIQIDFAAAKSQLSEARSKAELKKSAPPDAALPLDAFRSPEFDGEVGAGIQKVIANPSLQPVSKIQACVKVITTHYNRKLNELEGAVGEARKENQGLSSRFRQLLLDMAIALNEKPVQTESILELPFLQQIVKSVGDLRQASDNLTHERDSLKAIVSHFAETFNPDNPDHISAINYLRKVLTEQASKLSKRSKEVKQLKREVARRAKELADAESEHSQSSRELSNKVEELSEQLQSANLASNAVKAQNQRLHSELEDAEDSLRRTQAQLQDSQFHLTQKSAAETSEKLEKLQQECANLQRSADDSKREQTRLRQLNQKQLIEIHELEAELKDQKGSVNRATEVLLERYEAEKAELKKAHENATAMLRKEMERQRSDVEQISAVLAQTEAQYGALKAENEQLAKKYQRLKNEVKLMKDSTAKEKKLSELAVVANRVSLENEFDTRCDELKTRTECEKRKLFGFGAEAFKRFFNPMEEIDERAFKRVVTQAREELERLVTADQAIRRLVDAAEHQTTEDAVARFVMDAF